MRIWNGPRTMDEKHVMLKVVDEKEELSGRKTSDG